MTEQIYLDFASCAGLKAMPLLDEKTIKEAADPPPHTKATRVDWLIAAREVMLAEGVERVKVLTLAKRLEISRASFYWYFKDKTDLLNAVLERWRGTNTSAILVQADMPSESVFEGVINIFECWVDEALFDARLDFAVREWARRSEDVRKEVDIADDDRVDTIKAMFLRHGYEDQDAFIRARVLYFMQIGYYALELGETTSTRMKYIADYLRSFTGQEPPADAVAKYVERLRAKASS